MMTVLSKENLPNTIKVGLTIKTNQGLTTQDKTLLESNTKRKKMKRILMTTEFLC